MMEGRSCLRACVVLVSACALITLVSAPMMFSQGCNSQRGIIFVSALVLYGMNGFAWFCVYDPGSNAV